MSDVSFAESLDRLKESFLWAAAQGGNREDCESLISFGADVNWKNPEGDTPLLAACRRGHAETVSLLLAHGADSNVCGKDSLTPLHVCTKRGDSSTLNALLEGNTNTTIATKDGQTALDIAKAKGFTDIYSVLMGYRGRLARPDNLLPAPSVLGQSTPAAPRRAGELQPVSASASQSSTRSVGSSSARGSANNIAVGAALGRRTGSSDSLHRANSHSGGGGANSGSLTPLQQPAASSSGDIVDDFMERELAMAAGSSNTNAATPTNVASSAGVAALSSASSSVKVSTPASTNRIPQMPSASLSSKEPAPASGSSGVSSTSSSVKKFAASSLQAANSALTTSTLTSNSTTTTAATTTTTTTAAAPTAPYPNPSSGVNYLIASLQKKEGGDPTVVSLKNMLDAEVARRTDIEDKLNKFKEQHQQLLREMTSLNAQFNALQEDAAESEAYLARLLGKKSALDELNSIEECEELERLLKTSLECVEERKALIIRDKIGSQKEQRLCVICQENDKTVVLIPCRHMCLCEGCSNHKQLKQCPLCRKTIESKISVFS